MRTLHKEEKFLQQKTRLDHKNEYLIFIKRDICK